MAGTDDVNVLGLHAKFHPLQIIGFYVSLNWNVFAEPDTTVTWSEGYVEEIRKYTANQQSGSSQVITQEGVPTRLKLNWDY